MVNFNNGKIYKLVSVHTPKCYIGSTCEPTLAKRKAKHKIIKKFLSSITRLCVVYLCCFVYYSVMGS